MCPVTHSISTWTQVSFLNSQVIIFFCGSVLALNDLFFNQFASGSLASYHRLLIVEWSTSWLRPYEDQVVVKLLFNLLFFPSIGETISGVLYYINGQTG